jgi:putative transposase
LCKVRLTKGRTNEGARRRYGISKGTCYKHKSKYGSIEPSDAKRLRTLKDETGKREKLPAEQMLDNVMPRGIGSKSW